MMRRSKLSRALRISLILLIVMPCLTSGRSLANTACFGGGCHLYLPAFVYDPQLILLAPAADAPISSLAPVLIWRPPFTGLFHIQVSIDPSFASLSTVPLSTTVDIKTRVPGAIETLITANLNPQHTYYWRVSKTVKNGNAVVAVSHFTTLLLNKHRLPPAVHVLAPANNARLRSQAVQLQWQSIPNALFYRIRMYDASDTLFRAGSMEVIGAATTLTVAGLTSGMTYHWKVKALNSYGWGPYLGDLYFNVP